MSKINNAADETQVKTAAKKEKFREDSDTEAFKWVLSTPQGRRVIWKYLEECGVFKSSLHNSGSMTYFLEGQRNIGLKLLAEINSAKPEAYLEMLKEKENYNV